MHGSEESFEQYEGGHGHGHSHGDDDADDSKAKPIKR